MSRKSESVRCCQWVVKTSDSKESPALPCPLPLLPRNHRVGHLTNWFVDKTGLDRFHCAFDLKSIQRPGVNGVPWARTVGRLKEELPEETSGGQVARLPALAAEYGNSERQGD